MVSRLGSIGLPRSGLVQYRSASLRNQRLASPESSLQGKTTFIFVKRFLKVNRSRPGVTIPLEWYQ